MLAWLMNLDFAATAVSGGGGDSMSLAQMRARERAQLAALLKDDEEVLPLLIEIIRRRK